MTERRGRSAVDVTRQAFTVLGLAALAVATSACSGPPPPATSPVILATPTSVCLGDDYETPITLDGTQSSATLTLIPIPADASAPPLKYHWTLAGSLYRIVSGSLTSEKLTVTIAGEEPLQVDLNVQNSVGGSADSTVTIAVTIFVDAGDDASSDGAPLDAAADSDSGSDASVDASADASPSGVGGCGHRSRGG